MKHGSRIFAFLAILCVPSFASTLFSQEKDDEENGIPVVYFPAFSSYKKPNFECRSASGRYPHELDCQLFYECKFGYPHLMRCHRNKLFDQKKQQCEDARRVTCNRHDRDWDDRDHNNRDRDNKNDRERDHNNRDRDNKNDWERDQNNRDRDNKNDRDRDQNNRDRDNKNDRDKDRDNKNNRDRDRDHKKDKDHDHDNDHRKKEKDNFRCPYIWGSFPHPVDCSRYYVCAYNEPTAVQCRPSQLYDIRSKRCQDRRRVHCGDRLDKEHIRTTQRPTTASYRTTPTWDKKTTGTENPIVSGGFKCPFPNGRFADPEDCSRFFECRGASARVQRCPRSSLYDERREECLPDSHVRCGDRPGGNGDDDSRESKREPLRCPYTWGTFPHRHDCSKYLVCVYNVPKVYNCRRSELFHSGYRRCYPKEQVKCDRRINPDDQKPPSRRTTRNPVTRSTRTETTRYTRIPFTRSTRRETTPYTRNPGTRSTRPPYTRGTRPPYTRETRPPYTRGTRPPYTRETRPPYTRETRTQHTRGTRPPYTRETRPPHTRGTRSIYSTHEPTPSIGTSTLSPVFTTVAEPTTTPEPATITPEPTTTNEPTTTPKQTTTSPEPTTTTREPTTTPEPTTIPEPTTTTPEPTTTTPEPTTNSESTTTTPEPITTTPEPTTNSEPTTTTPEPTKTTPEPTTTTEAPISSTTPEPATSQTRVPEGTHSLSPTQPETTEAVTKPNTPPPTDCEDDDLDCIVDETGDVEGWFDCPERYGHFPHGSSRQLFIHCDNFKPFVKRCADGTAFSPEYLVCTWS